MVVVEREVSLFSRSPHLYLFNGVFGWSCPLPRKEEIVDWLSHISRSRRVRVIPSYVLSHFLHHLHFSKLFLCHGYSCHMMFVEIPSHHFQHLPWIGMSIRARKTLETVSRTWICTRSSENPTEYMKLLFCTEIIILSNNWVKSTF